MVSQGKKILTEETADFCTMVLENMVRVMAIG